MAHCLANSDESAFSFLTAVEILFLPSLIVFYLKRFASDILNWGACFAILIGVTFKMMQSAFLGNLLFGHILNLIRRSLWNIYIVFMQIYTSQVFWWENLLLRTWLAHKFLHFVIFHIKSKLKAEDNPAKWNKLIGFSQLSYQAVLLQLLPCSCWAFLISLQHLFFHIYIYI